ncbi:MAG: formate dehydrogenase accessory sulfurtransferase FdhD [Planctomycetota bacterium]
MLTGGRRAGDGAIAAGYDREVPTPDPSTERTPGAARRRALFGKVVDLVDETPLWISVDGQRLVTMRTRGRDADLALGFLIGEGIVDSAGDVRELRCIEGKDGAADEVRALLRRPANGALRGRLSRAHEIRASCGACGLEDPAAILEGTSPLLPGVPRVPLRALSALQASMRRRQSLFSATGGCHAALVAAPFDEVLGFGEDVGRHNALDKAIGEAARRGTDLSRAMVLLSGRAGYDLVMHCLRARIPVILSVSAPSSLAFDLCEAAGATLVGFLRGEDYRVYCDASHRLADARA